MGYLGVWSGGGGGVGVLYHGVGQHNAGVVQPNIAEACGTGDEAVMKLLHALNR